MAQNNSKQTNITIDESIKNKLIFTLSKSPFRKTL